MNLLQDLVEPRRRFDVEQDRRGGDRPVEIEHRNVTAAVGCLERGGGDQRGRPAAAGAGEPDDASRHLPARPGYGGSRGGLSDRPRGDRLDQIVVHPGKKQLAAAPGRRVGADGEHDGSHLADFGQFMDGAGRVGQTVDVDDNEWGGMAVGERRDGGAEPAGPDLGIVVLGGWRAVVQQPFAKRVFGFRVRGEGKRRGPAPDRRGAMPLLLSVAGLEPGKARPGDRVTGQHRRIEGREIALRIGISGRRRRILGESPDQEVLEFGKDLRIRWFLPRSRLAIQSGGVEVRGFVRRVRVIGGRTGAVGARARQGALEVGEEIESRRCRLPIRLSVRGRRVEDRGRGFPFRHVPRFIRLAGRPVHASVLEPGVDRIEERMRRERRPRFGLVWKSAGAGSFDGTAGSPGDPSTGAGPRPESPAAWPGSLAPEGRAACGEASKFMGKLPEG